MKVADQPLHSPRRSSLLCHLCFLFCSIGLNYIRKDNDGPFPGVGGPLPDKHWQGCAGEARLSEQEQESQRPGQWSGGHWGSERSQTGREPERCLLGRPRRLAKMGLPQAGGWRHGPGAALSSPSGGPKAGVAQTGRGVWRWGRSRHLFCHGRGLSHRPSFLLSVSLIHLYFPPHPFVSICQSGVAHAIARTLAMCATNNPSSYPKGMAGLMGSL